MGKRFPSLSSSHISFIRAQKLFFVGTATDRSRVNISPKGMDCLRIVDPRRLLWLNVTGSGNETAAHLRTHPRMTLMFCAFEGQPQILRIYGRARPTHPSDPEWSPLAALFPPLPGARQIFDVEVEQVQSSCGMAVPFFEYIGERDDLNRWAGRKGEEGIRQYWRDRNHHTIDNLPTGMLEALSD